MPNIPFEAALAGRRVLVTGHTGFKGSWLSLWLAELGADVHGIALPPASKPALFDAANITSSLGHTVKDVRDGDGLIEAVAAIDPEVVFHLAAQPIVRRSYDQPRETIETNTLGTANLLEACRLAPNVRAILCVTTDKVYENREWVWPYRETDSLGGKDPYSASKAAAELIAASYRHLFILKTDGPALATARGGNVIGGGDWSEDRLIPDIARAVNGGRELVIRNPEASRPWQHVLALCHGYLQLAGTLLTDRSLAEGAWNFGPGEQGVATVRELIDAFARSWARPRIVEQPAPAKPEHQLLSLDSTKAVHQLHWRSPWTLEDSVARTAQWYRDYYADPTQARALTMKQLNEYRDRLAGAASGSD